MCVIVGFIYFRCCLVCVCCWHLLASADKVHLVGVGVVWVHEYFDTCAHGA